MLTQIEALREAIDALDPSQGGDLTSLIARIAQAEADIDNLESYQAELQTRADTLEQNLSDLDTQATQAVTTLTDSITSETTTRQAADAGLQEQIDAHTVTLGNCASASDLAEESAARLRDSLYLDKRIAALESKPEPQPTDPTRRYISDCTSYVTIEQAILDDIHNAENTVREWLADFPQNGGTDTWHYQLLSIGSTGLAKVLRTNSAGIFLLSAAKTATKFTATQKLAF